MPFTLTQSDGTLVLGSPDGSVLAPEVDELNKVCERIEQEKTYTNRAESEVSSIAEQVKTDALSVPDGLKQALAVEQNLETNMKKIKKRPFTVYAIDEHGKPIEHPDPSHPDPSVKVFDILIHTEDLNVPEERADFKVEVDRTVTVVDVVLKTEANGLWRFLPWTPSSLQRKKERRAEYMAGLRGICYVGLAHEDPSQLKLASKSLTTFREDFVAKEAGMVKNTYLSRLGVACLLMAVFSSLAYVYARSLPEGHVVHDFRNFFLLTTGASVGTWLSFSLRRPVLSFLDLATLEEDRLDPGLRVLFVTALASIVGLLLWTGAVTIGVGTFTTINFGHGATAFLIGLLLGIAERTMATAVEKRATEFGAAIGGK